MGRPISQNGPSKTTMWRRRNAQADSDAIKEVIPTTCGRPQAPSGPSRATIWRRKKAQEAAMASAQKAERICNVYASGERYGTESFQNKAHKSHRRVFIGDGDGGTDGGRGTGRQGNRAIV
ncbi:hypothetical protein FN846DRAFT_890812 [Sphaerosporella brunnea]|uniref:Uncharacterized protein n=1 Tax=Sphaerosporella brunnea TaxID=1250544 RepID=A0A5J5EV92_9PEZI|nr:hypothetical protein FN846DRAFT_890812 [Sphaerosporella brunnea]